MPDDQIVLRRWLQVLAAGEISAWPDVVADDVVIEFPFLHGGDRVLRGFDVARDVIGAFWKIFEVFEWEDVEITETSNPGLFVTRANSRARTLSGLEYVNSYVLLIRIADGKVARHTEYFDPILAAALMGSGRT